MSDADLTITLVAEHEYVLGLPVPVAVTLGGVPQGVTLMSLPEPSLFDLGGCIGATLSRDREPVFSELPAGRFDTEHDPPSLTLRHGQPRRYLIELAELLPAGLKPGDYELQLGYVAPKLSARSAPVTITLRAPIEAERRWLNSQAAALDQAGSWGLWVLEPPAEPPAAATVAAAPAPARFYSALRYLAHADGPSERLDVRVLSEVAGIARPEALLLAAELALVQGNTSAAQKLETRLLTDTPELGWRLELAKQGAGVLAGLRTN